MLDVYEIRKSKGSYESGVPILGNVEEILYFPGGVANVAVNLRSLGSIPYLIGDFGKDNYGEILDKELKIKDINTNLCFKGLADQREYLGKDTTTKTRFYEKRGRILIQKLRVDHDVILNLNEGQIDYIIRRVTDIINEVDGIIFEDYNKGFLHENLTKIIIELATEKEKPVFVDPKNNYKRFPNVTIFKPNTRELREMTGIKNNNIDACKKIYDEIHPKYFLITDSINGIYRYDDGIMDLRFARPKLIHPVNIVGAGDTVIATLSLAYLAGATIKQAADIANIAAGIAISKHFTAQPTLDELLKELE